MTWLNLTAWRLRRRLQGSVDIDTDGVVTFPAGVGTVGTWTPTLIGTTTAGTHVYSLQAGDSFKLGRLCWVNFRIAISSLNDSGPAMAGDLRIAGLNDTSANTNTYGGSINFYDNDWTVTDDFMCRVINNGTEILLTEKNAALTDADVTGTPQLYGSAIYLLP